jgi:hypothetical protein
LNADASAYSTVVGLKDITTSVQRLYRPRKKSLI